MSCHHHLWKRKKNFNFFDNFFIFLQDFNIHYIIIYYSDNIEFWEYEQTYNKFHLTLHVSVFH